MKPTWLSWYSSSMTLRCVCVFECASGCVCPCVSRIRFRDRYAYMYRSVCPGLSPFRFLNMPFFVVSTLSDFRLSEDRNHRIISFSLGKLTCLHFFPAPKLLPSIFNILRKQTPIFSKDCCLTRCHDLHDYRFSLLSVPCSLMSSR